jgi:DNA-binding transcriptional ArsR family regulator
MADQAAADAFEALLGWQRVEILRRLDAEQRPGEIAQALRMVPAGATHHLSRLEAAGLLLVDESGTGGGAMRWSAVADRPLVRSASPS